MFIINCMIIHSGFNAMQVVTMYSIFNLNTKLLIKVQNKKKQ